MELADDARTARPLAVPAGDRRPGRPGPGGAAARRRAAHGGRVEAEAAADQLDHALRVVEVERACRPVPGRLLGRAGEHEREPPPLAGHAGRRRRSPCRSRRSRRRRGRAAGSSPTISTRLPTTDRRSTEWSARQRVRDRDRPAAGRRPTGDRRRLGGQTNALGLRRARRARGSRPRSGRPRRASRGSGPGRRAATGAKARHRRVRQGRRDRLVAADAGDLLGHVGLDDDVAAPGRDDRDEHVAPGPRSTASGSAPAATARSGRPARRPPAPSRPDAGEERALLAGRERARAAGSPGRAGTGRGSDPARPARVSTRPRATEPPAHSATSRAARSAPIRASRVSWPFSNRRLASDRSA